VSVEMASAELFAGARLVHGDPRLQLCGLRRVGPLEVDEAAVADPGAASCQKGVASVGVRPFGCRDGPAVAVHHPAAHEPTARVCFAATRFSRHRVSRSSVFT
jgi:hypothetical protein